MTATTQAPPLTPTPNTARYQSPFGEDYLSIGTVEGDAGRLAWVDADHGTAIVAPDTPQLEATIRRAIADPGKWTPRQQDRDGNYEPLPRWQTRAVLTALRRPLGSGQ